MEDVPEGSRRDGLLQEYCARRGSVCACGVASVAQPRTTTRLFTAGGWLAWWVRFQGHFMASRAEAAATRTARDRGSKTASSMLPRERPWRKRVDQLPCRGARRGVAWRFRRPPLQRQARSGFVRRGLCANARPQGAAHSCL